MFGNKARNTVVVLFILLISSFLLSACSIEEIGDTIGGCCGASTLPIAAIGMVMASRSRNAEK